MSESGYHKCPCRNCQQRIEFPEEVAGSEIPCPHCGKDTLLFIPRPAAAAPVRTPAAAPVVTTPEPTQSPWDDPAFEEKIRCKSCGAKASKTDKNCPNCGAAMKRSKLQTAFRVVGGITILGLLIALPFMLPKKGKGSGPGGKAGPDLTIYPHSLRKEPGGNLTYVVGNIANHSENRYLSLKVEFELQGTNGVALGTTSDFLPVLEPGKTWNFKAMVIDPDATSAKMLGWSAERYVEHPKLAEERKAAEKKKKEEAEKKKK
jgi:predicted RNA-binding Zn-ribbon protein involved in translation (DUF1610 family)